MSNLQNCIRRAQAAAREAIVEWVKTSVEEIITTCTNDAEGDLLNA